MMTYTLPNRCSEILHFITNHLHYIANRHLARTASHAKCISCITACCANCILCQLYRTSGTQLASHSLHLLSSNTTSHMPQDITRCACLSHSSRWAVIAQGPNEDCDLSMAMIVPSLALVLSPDSLATFHRIATSRTFAALLQT
jgi:hypothetical protein